MAWLGEEKDGGGLEIFSYRKRLYVFLAMRGLALAWRMRMGLRHLHDDYGEDHSLDWLANRGTEIAFWALI